MVTGYYVYRLLDLVPLAEFREWVTTPFDAAAAKQMVASLCLLTEPTRWLSYGYTRLSGEIAGTDIVGVNAFNLLPLPLTCAAIWKLSRQLGLGVASSALAPCFWAFSLPVMDAYHWQATIHDRMALLFSCLALNCVMAFLRRPYGRLRCLWTNVLTLVCTAFAYQSKESAFYLAPSLVALLALYPAALADTPTTTVAAIPMGNAPIVSPARRWIGILGRRARAVIAPLLYVVAHHTRYAIAYARDAEMQAHTAGAGWTDHLAPSLGNLLSSSVVPATDVAPPRYGDVSPILSVLVATVLGVGLLRRKIAPRGGFHLRMLLWLALTLALATAITLRTQYQSPFYQYSSRAWLVLTSLYAVHGACLIAVRPTSLLDSRLATARRVASRIAEAVCLAVLLRFDTFVYMERWMPAWDHHLMRLHNLARSFATIRLEVVPRPETHFRFATSLQDREIWTVFTDREFGLLRFIYRRADVGHDNPIAVTYGIDLATWQPPDSAATWLVYDRDLRLHSIYADGVQRYTAPH